MMNQISTYRLGELFCGPGGMAMGAHFAAGRVPGVAVQHAWANDYDQDTCATYQSNVPGASASTVICSDVSDLEVSKLEEIDGFAFGFPCNDFSLVGEKKGVTGKFGPLYSYGVNVLNVHSPKWFIAENVGGLSSSNQGKAFLKILQALSSAGKVGYRLVPHLYKFEKYGLPQARHRILVVGIRNDLDAEFKVPSPEPYSRIDNSVGLALTEPPISPEAANNELTKQSDRVVQRLMHIKPGQNAFNSNLPEELRLNVKGAQISQIYKRLDPKKPSYTITGSGGGGTHVYHWEQPRALTNRERARIQTFPDSFVFRGSKESVRKQIGMAVPVKGAEIVFEALFKSMSNIGYPSVDSNMQQYLNAALSLDPDE